MLAGYDPSAVSKTLAPPHLNAEVAQLTRNAGLALDQSETGNKQTIMPLSEQESGS